jgi:hypothetical protein
MMATVAVAVTAVWLILYQKVRNGGARVRRPQGRLRRYQVDACGKFRLSLGQRGVRRYLQRPGGGRECRGSARAVQRVTGAILRASRVQVRRTVWRHALALARQAACEEIVEGARQHILPPIPVRSGPRQAATPDALGLPRLD